MSIPAKSASSRDLNFTLHSNSLRADLTEDGTPIFHAGDLCTLLGYKNPRAAIRRHVDQEDVAKRDTLTDGGIQKATWVTEPGMWALIFGSETEQAKAVKRWVFRDVLPAIRRQGYYALPGTAIGILPPHLFRKELHGKPACLGSSLWAVLGVETRLTKWLPLRLENFSLGLDYEWVENGGDALITRATAEEIAARSWTPGARKLRYVWGESVCGEGEALGGAA